jgi:hypothetical protein
MSVVAVQLSVAGLYLPPVFKVIYPQTPPHTIISLPVQIALGLFLRNGALVMLVAVHVLSTHGESPSETVGRL